MTDKQPDAKPTPPQTLPWKDWLKVPGTSDFLAAAANVQQKWKPGQKMLFAEFEAALKKAGQIPCGHTKPDKFVPVPRRRPGRRR